MTEKQSLDTLNIQRNDDGSFRLEWDKNDPNWTWLNDLTSDEIRVMVESALDDYIKENEYGQ
jgi:hypothetical protein